MADDRGDDAGNADTDDDDISRQVVFAACVFLKTLLGLVYVAGASLQTNNSCHSGSRVRHAPY